MHYLLQSTIFPNKNFKELSQTLPIGVSSTPALAISQMWRFALADVRRELKDGAEVSITQTSDSRYPDAWGYANNGLLITSGSKLIQWEVVEV